MVKRKKMMQKQLKTDPPNDYNEKALNILASFFITKNENVRFAQESLSVLSKKNPKGVSMLRKSSLF
jgi:hypothetical protein